MVSKSAQYCYTDPQNPVGLMLLSEVALGEIYELKKAKVHGFIFVLHPKNRLARYSVNHKII